VDAPLVTNDSSADTALANTLLLSQFFLIAAQSNTVLQLPSGTIHIGYGDSMQNAIGLDERHSGLTIQGNGRSATLLINQQDIAPPLIVRSTRIPVEAHIDFRHRHARRFPHHACYISGCRQIWSLRCRVLLASSFWV
jgi:hypothetical protein